MSILNPTDPTIFTGIGNPVVLGQLTTTDPLTPQFTSSQFTMAPRPERKAWSRFRASGGTPIAESSISH